MNKVKKHLDLSQVSYWQHAGWAIVAGAQLILAGLASFVHAIYPGWFTGTSAKTVIRLYHQRLIGHPNKEYQDYIEQQSKETR